MSLLNHFDFVRVNIIGLPLQTLLTQALHAKTTSIPNHRIAGYKFFPLPATVTCIISKTVTRSKINWKTLQGITKNIISIQIKTNYVFVITIIILQKNKRHLLVRVTSPSDTTFYTLQICLVAEHLLCLNFECYL